MRKNFRSDISIRESFYDYDQSGERIQSLVPENVRIEYFTPAYPRVRLVCSRYGDTFHNCSLSENGRVLVCNLALSRKSLGVGPLLKIVKHSVADSSFPYDFQNKEHIASTGIDLWGGPSDAGELESESVLSEVILRYGYSAYRLAVLDGFEGTEQEWLESLIGDEGKSAYQVAVDNGFEGTVAEWLASLVGAPGKSAYQVAVDNGFEGTEQEWLESLIGDEGKSAYQVAVDNGFDGTVAEWLASLIGPQGKSAYQIAVENGFEGTEEEWLLSLQGKSAYEIAVELGYEGTEEQWIASLKGEDGVPGTTPHIGQNGHWFIGDTDTNVVAEGQDGAPGQDGSDGTDGTDGITPHIGSNGNWYIGDDDTEVPATGPAGQDGSPGITAEDVEDVQDVEATLAAVALKKTAQTLTPAEKAQVWENLGIDDISGKADKILVADSVPVGGMRPNTFYNLGTLTGSVSIEFSVASDNTIYNEWMFQFETGSTAPTITWPAAITLWLGGSAPTLNAYKKYQVSVVNGLAVIGEF